jgi:AraC-like DNA-binding protein
MLWRLEYLRERPRMPTDPLSDVLSLLKLRSFGAGGFDVGGEWALGFQAYEGIKCYAVVTGGGWLAVEGEEPVELHAGDCYLLPRGRPFQLACKLGLLAVDARPLFRLAQGRGFAVVNGGGGCTMVGGHFSLHEGHAKVLLDVLPAVVHLRTETDKEALRWAVERMRLELEAQLPGSLMVAEHLAHMLLVQALRLHMEENERGVGWLFALADKQMAAAIAAMHERPEQRWTLEELAQRVGISRSSFAARFKGTVGMSAMEYLTRWRMLLAAERLGRAKESVAEIALALGYESESSFGTAFKREMGVSPRRYGRMAVEEIAAD